MVLETRLTVSTLPNFGNYLAGTILTTTIDTGGSVHVGIVRTCSNKLQWLMATYHSSQVFQQEVRIEKFKRNCQIKTRRCLFITDCLTGSRSRLRMRSVFMECESGM